MDATQILDADLLDIIFDGKNKDYGAYELRRSYDQRLRKAMTITASLLVVFIALFITLSNSRNSVVSANPIPPDVDLAKDPNIAEPKLPTPPPPPKAPAPQVQARAFTNNIRVVHEARPDEMPPEVAELDHVRIGKISTQGNIDDGVVAPPVSAGMG